MVLKFLDDVYQARTSLKTNTSTLLPNELMVYINQRYNNSQNKTEKAKDSDKSLGSQPMPVEYEYHINHILNLIEEIFIAIEEGVIDEEIVTKNCIIIFVEYYVLFNGYIEEKNTDTDLKKLAFCGHFTSKMKAWERTKATNFKKNHINTELIKALKIIVKNRYGLEHLETASSNDLNSLA